MVRLGAADSAGGPVDRGSVGPGRADREWPENPEVHVWSSHVFGRWSLCLEGLEELMCFLTSIHSVDQQAVMMFLLVHLVHSPEPI